MSPDFQSAGGRSAPGNAAQTGPAPLTLDEVAQHLYATVSMLRALQTLIVHGRNDGLDDVNGEGSDAALLAALAGDRVHAAALNASHLADPNAQGAMAEHATCTTRQAARDDQALRQTIVDMDAMSRQTSDRVCALARLIVTLVKAPGDPVTTHRLLDDIGQAAGVIYSLSADAASDLAEAATAVGCAAALDAHGRPCTRTDLIVKGVRHA